MTQPDWTEHEGRTNCSPLFECLVIEVARLIRGDAFALLDGGADRTARLIIAQLAHVHGLAPLEATSWRSHCEAAVTYAEALEGSVRKGWLAIDGAIERENAIEGYRKAVEALNG